MEILEKNIFQDLRKETEIACEMDLERMLPKNISKSDSDNEKPEFYCYDGRKIDCPFHRRMNNESYCIYPEYLNNVDF